MANLSNINNKFIVTDGGNVLIGQTSAVGSSIFQVTGSVNITGGTTSGLNITTSGTQDTININRAANNDNAITKYQTASVDKWIVGLRNTGDDNFRFYSYGTSSDVLTINQASGNVGIGTTLPSVKLEVAGNIGLKSDSAYLRFRNAAAADLGYITNSTTWGDSGNDFSIGASSSNLRFYTNNSSTEKMRIDSSGQITNTMSGGKVLTDTNGFITSFQTLDVATAGGRYKGKSNRGLLGQLRIEQTATGADGGYITLDTSASGSTSPTERMRINSSGNVGIGTTSPSSKLSISGSQTAIDLTRGTAGDSKWGLSSDSTALYIAELSTGSTDYIMTFKETTGNVGIGTTSPDSLLEISKAQASGPILKITEPTQGNGTTEGGPGNNLGVLGFVSADTSTSQANLIRASVEGQPGEKPYGTGGLLTFNTMQTYSGSGTLTDLIERMRITSTGNVGIGTTSPGAKLQIGSATYAPNGNLTNNLLQIKSPSGFAYLTIGNGDTANATSYIGGASGFIVLGSVTDAGAASEHIRMTDTGNVGIGTTTPDQKLQVGGNFHIYDEVGNTDASLFMTTGSSNTTTVKIASNGTSYLNGGNVGIGTTSPDSLLQLESSANPDVELKISNTATVVSGQNFGGSKVRLIADGTNGDGEGALRHALVSETDSYSNWEIRTGNELGTLAFDTLGSERMRITSGGKLYFNTTGDATTTDPGLVFYPSGDNVYVINAVSLASAWSHFQFINPNGTVGSIVTSGSATAYNTSSDYRLKEDLQDFKGLDMVSKIPVYDFKWKTDESRSYGVMAHELQEVLPDAVSGKKDAEEMQGVDYSKIVPLLVKSIQELEAKIKILENK